MDPIRLARLYALALCVWREARGESALGKLLVAQVIENRVVDPRWPESYVGVITQPLQFSSYNKLDPNALLFPEEKDATWADCVAVAECVIDAPKPFTTANHYHTKGVAPTWSNGKVPTIVEGAHLFFTL